MIFAAAAVGQTGSFAERDTRYRLQPTDVVEVHYRYSPEFDQTVTVQPDGFVNLQIVGDVKVQGLRMAPTRPSIMSEGATMLAPARACNRADFASHSSVISLSTAPSLIKPQWP